MSLCKCGRALSLGTEIAAGKCWACGPKVESKSLLKREVVQRGSVTGNVTKQRKWDANNPDKVRAANATRKARWRASRRTPTGSQ